MGGVGTLYLAVRYPEVWAAVAPAGGPIAAWSYPFERLRDFHVPVQIARWRQVDAAFSLDGFGDHRALARFAHRPARCLGVAERHEAHVRHKRPDPFLCRRRRRESEPTASTVEMALESDQLDAFGLAAHHIW